MKQNEKIILFPLTEEAFNETTPAMIETIKKTPNRVVVVNKKGKITNLLEKRGISYTFLASDTVVTSRMFWLTAVFKLLGGSLPQFIFIRQLENPVDFVYFSDLISAMSWSGTTRMFRLTYIISLSQMERFSKYATIILKDARFLLAPTPFVKETTPEEYQRKIYVTPTLPRVSFFSDKERQKFLKKKFPKQNQKETTLFMATDVDNQNTALIRFKEEFEERSGKKIVVLAKNESEWFEQISCCDFFAGFDDCTVSAVYLWGAMSANIPVFTVQRGTYVSLIQENENGLFLTPENVEEQVKTVNDFLQNVEKRKEFKENQKRWYEILKKKTVDFIEKMYDSV